MTNILLTGAGFSRNWGGMLAKDIFSHLLGDQSLDDYTRGLLLRAHTSHGSFEDVLAALQGATDPVGKAQYAALIGALVGLFNGMGQAFIQRNEIEFKVPADTRYWLRGFLQRFQYIFTTNQDTLMESLYMPLVGPTPFGRAHIPGMKFSNPAAFQGHVYDRIAQMEPNPSDFTLNGNVQFYIKLHGSCNWVESSSGGRILIMGGQKTVAIGRFPILTFYHDQFRQLVTRPGAKLMVIGYSFSDEHINEVILDAALNHKLEVFIVDPRQARPQSDDYSTTRPVDGPDIEDKGIFRPSSIIDFQRRPLRAVEVHEFPWLKHRRGKYLLLVHQRMELEVTGGGFGVLVDRHDDCLNVVVAPPFSNGDITGLSQSIEEGRIIFGVGVVHFGISPRITNSYRR